MCGGMVKNSVVGFVGAGRIGSSIMQRLKAFQPAQILYSTRNRSPAIEEEHSAKYSTLAELLAMSDIVVVCCSLNASTKHLLGEEQFRAMKPTAILVNTSRGAVVDQKALYEALKSKEIAAAGLDVMEVEPMPTDDPLLELDNVGKSTRVVLVQGMKHHSERVWFGRLLPLLVERLGGAGLWQQSCL